MELFLILLFLGGLAYLGVSVIVAALWTLRADERRRTHHPDHREEE